MLSRMRGLATLLITSHEPPSICGRSLGTVFRGLGFMVYVGFGVQGLGFCHEDKQCGRISPWL